MKTSSPLLPPLILKGGLYKVSMQGDREFGGIVRMIKVTQTTATGIFEKDGKPLDEGASPLKFRRRKDGTWVYVPARFDMFLAGRVSFSVPRISPRLTTTEERRVSTATDREGKKIRRGEWVALVPGHPVLVEDIYRQGADGTILRTKPAPNPEYPHHFSCRASEVLRLPAAPLSQDRREP